MNPEPIRQLISALRSGKYEQTIGVLRENDRFCVLGVACDLYDPSRWSDPIDDTGARAYIEQGIHYDLSAPNSVLQHYGISPPLANDIVFRNDDGESFADIADFLEQQLYGISTTSGTPKPGT